MSRIETTWLWRWPALPALTCIALHAAALWPQGLWMWRRVLDGSDDPLGVIAIGTLVLIVARLVHSLRTTPSGAWILLATVLLLCASLAQLCLPPLLAALFGMLSLAAALAAWLPARIARLPLAGFAVLALPLISSLQFYAGYPLRIITAEMSAWVLRAVGLAAERTGASMTIQGQLVIVDAPCSGVQLAWMAYFSACAIAALRGLGDRVFLMRLPLVGLLVITGNLVRNVMLVLLEIRPAGLDDAAHEAVGLVVLSAVCLLVLRLMSPSARVATSSCERIDAASGPVQHRWTAGIVPSLIASAFAGQALVSVSRAEPLTTPAADTEWRRTWNGASMRPLALSAVERRFAERFPGHIGRFDIGAGTLVLREVREPTRMLHPAVDCYRGLGYHVGKPVLERDEQRRLRRCFVAERVGQRQRVCEQIVDANGQTFTDASAWYWSALLGRSQGPWLAVTQAMRF